MIRRNLLLQVTGPAVLVGLLLCGACLVSAWYVNRLQSGLADILANNVASMQAAQQLEISARQLRFHCFLYLLDPDPAILRDIQADQDGFAAWLVRAEQTASTPGEQAQVVAIRQGFDRYRAEFARERAAVEHRGPLRPSVALAEANPIRHVTDPCRAYLRTNEELLAQAVAEGEWGARWLRMTMALLGLAGPLGGLLGGYGIARGLSRSLYRLSVRVQDVAQQLDRDVAALHLAPDADLHHLDAQLQHVLARVGEVARQLQRHQQEAIRAQQLAAVGQLAASVAHEVRNPLTSIKLLVEAALRPSKPRPFTAENLRVVHGEILRLEQTVQGLLDFARPPALDRRPCDLRAVAAQAAELVRARARQQGVAVTVSAPADPVTAAVDRGQLCSVLVNLLVNALDAMPGGGRLTVAVEADARHGARVRVADTGTGIPAEVLDRLFTPFVTTKPTGSGLGLSICKRVVEDHGGTLSAANRPGGGACFTVRLPPPREEERHADPAGG